MANKELFARATNVPATDAVNEAGGKAYNLTPEEALAQIAATGTFNKTYYGSPSDQLAAIRETADKCSPLFIAKCAIYARQKGGMKDMPAALAVMLSKADMALLDAVFDRVIDNGKQLRNFCQMILSGAFGRKGLASGPKRLVSRWLNTKSPQAILRAKVGSNPSLATIIKLAHPKPKDEMRQALFAWLLGRDVEHSEHLPEIVKQLEAFRMGASDEVPNVDFRLLDGAKLTPKQWAAVAKVGGFRQTIKNFNTYLRQGVFGVSGMEQTIAEKVRDEEQIRKSRVFPTEIMAAYVNSQDDVPFMVRDALQDAMEIATENVPEFGVETIVVVDVSGSMGSPVTGYRKGATSKVRCVEAAALIAATVARRNPGTMILPVDTRVHSTKDINPRDAVLSIAARLARYGGGGTDLSAALRHLNKTKAKAGLILIVSDNESWVDSTCGYGWGYRSGTATMNEFRAFEKRNKGAKMVCLNLQPYTTTQASTVPQSILNLGGFTDALFTTVARFVKGSADMLAPADGKVSDWVADIEAIDVFDKKEKPSA
jgi:60 kDa SS-A/Ro ribonucleoprotein